MKKVLLVLSFCMVVSAGCAGSEPTAAPVVPTETQAAIATATSTSAPDDAAAPLDGDFTRLLIVPQRFSVEANALLRYNTDEKSVTVTNDTQDIFISFTYDANVDGLSPTELLDQYFAALEIRQIVMAYEPATDVNINGAEGVRVNFIGQVEDQSLEGSAVAVQSDAGWALIAIGMGNTQFSKAMWTDKGQPYFDQMLSSVKFLDATAVCPVSTDDTYGYTPENPIKVGGDAFGGASRESAYLDHLLDSDGGKITYERNGSNDFGGVILDIYVVTKSSGEESTLYVDMYNYAEPQAPVGFTCQGEFPLSAP